jgi:hypothetical protein
MKKRTTALAFALVGTIFMPVPDTVATATAATTAAADIVGGAMIHWAPDNGYDRPIRVRFAGERKFVDVPEGEHSDHLRPNGKEDVQEAKLRRLDGGLREEIVCMDNNGLGWFVWHDGPPGSKKHIGNFQNLICVIGLQGR